MELYTLEKQQQQQWSRGHHGDGWNDSSLVDQVPIVKLYPVPKMVHFVNYHGDEVSTLYEGSIQSLRNNNTDNDPSCLACGEEKIPDDSELRVDSCLPYEDEESIDFEIERRFFAELYCTPLKKSRSNRSVLDNDGSSYSTQRRQSPLRKTRMSETMTGTRQQTTSVLGVDVRKRQVWI